jgi:ribosomal protein L19E
MKIKCPKCGVPFYIKGHANGTKSARELSKAQLIAAIAKMTRDLKEMKIILKLAK